MINPAEIQAAAELLRAGRLVAFPTETVYGLGANALDPSAVAQIFAIKGRPAGSPLIVHVSSIEMAKSLAADWPDSAERLVGQFWPGPLTLVLAVGQIASGSLVQPVIPAIVTAGLSTVGLRMPSHPVALELLRAAGVPLAAPSANKFTRLSPTTADHVREDLGREIHCILDGGPCQIGIESTVLSLAGPRPLLLRPGGVSREQIEAVVGSVTLASDPVVGAHPSPGMHARHYSPRTHLFLVNRGVVPATGRGIYLQHTQPPCRMDIAIEQMPFAASDYATALYRTLHEADREAFEWIAVDVPPSKPEWEATLDRLHRAAARD